MNRLFLGHDTLFGLGSRLSPHVAGAVMVRDVDDEATVKGVRPAGDHFLEFPT